jgi:hypothetical protein
MRTTRQLIGLLVSAVVTAVAAWPVASFAQPAGVNPEAIKELRRATDYLAGLKQFRMETESAVDVLTEAGEKIQLGNRTVLTVQRPDKLRAERVGELVAQAFHYDGKSLSVSYPAQKYYATTAAPPTIEAALDFARDKLKVHAPAADLIYSNALERFTEGLTSAFIVGSAEIGGVVCVHLAFRNTEVDWQIWIEEGDKPMPRKFVVTSKKLPQSPQFSVTLSKWDAAPKVTDATFRFVPPKDSRQVDFLAAPGAAKK